MLCSFFSTIFGKFLDYASFHLGWGNFVDLIKVIIQANYLIFLFLGLFFHVAM